MDQSKLIGEALRLPADAIPYFVSRELTELFPEHAIVEASACSFGLERYAEAGLCRLALSPQTHSRLETHWHGTGYGLSESMDGGWYRVEWQEHTMEVLLLSWVEGYSKQQQC